MITFVYNDGGRSAAGFRGSTGDCVTRAIAIVTGKSYQEVYDTLNQLSKQMGYWNKVKLVKGQYGNSYKKLSSARTGVPRKVYDKYLKDVGMTWMPCMSIGSGCTVHLRADQLPKGRIICSLSKHLTAVIDGVVHDTYNPAREIHQTGVVAGQPYSKIIERCVYGYYTF